MIKIIQIREDKKMKNLIKALALSSLLLLSSASQALVICNGTGDQAAELKKTYPNKATFAADFKVEMYTSDWLGRSGAPVEVHSLLREGKRKCATIKQQDWPDNPEEDGAGMYELVITDTNNLGVNLTIKYHSLLSTCAIDIKYNNQRIFENPKAPEKPDPKYYDLETTTNKCAPAH